MHPLSKPKLSATSSNYYDYTGGELESLNTIRISTKTNFGGTLSADIGTDTSVKKSSSVVKPAVEVKYSQNIGKKEIFGNDINFRGYARYRHIGKDSNQLRIAAGASIPINKNLSIYTDAHYTTKFQKGKDKVGSWIGINYKLNQHLSAWAEPYQINVALDGTGKCSHMSNCGISYTF